MHVPQPVGGCADPPLPDAPLEKAKDSVEEAGAQARADEANLSAFERREEAGGVLVEAPRPRLWRDVFGGALGLRPCWRDFCPGLRHRWVIGGRS